MIYLADRVNESEEPFLSKSEHTEQTEYAFASVKPPLSQCRRGPFEPSKRFLYYICGLLLVVVVVLLGHDRIPSRVRALFVDAFTTLNVMAKPQRYRDGRKEAIATLLTDASWIPHLSVVTYGLDLHSPHRDRLVIIPDTFADNSTHFPPGIIDAIEQKLGWQVKRLPYIDVPGGKVLYQRYGDVMNKLHIW